MSLRTIWRKSLNVTMLSLTGACTLITVSVLFFILGYLIYNGGKDLSWNFFTKLPAPVGETGGGVANAIVGTGKLLILALLFGVPIGVMAGVYLAEFSGKTMGFIVRYTTDLLNGVPSIVIGIFAYAVVVVPMRHFSTLAGGFALGVMTIPITVRSTEQFLRAVPNPMRASGESFPGGGMPNFRATTASVSALTPRARFRKYSLQDCASAPRNSSRPCPRDSQQRLPVQKNSGQSPA